MKLSEGEKTDFSISLPDGICITEIYKVEVVDQTGQSWPVKWLPHKKLKKIATQEVLDESVKENERRVVSVTGYRVGEKFFWTQSSILSRGAPERFAEEVFGFLI